MQYQWITAPFAIISLITLAISLFLLLRKNWFAGWLRGNIGVILLFFAFSTGVIALNVNSYQPAVRETSIATISFDRLDKQIYKANVVLDANSAEMPFEIYGDLWQIDARIIKWKGWLSAFGSGPNYKLDRIQGRYYTIEDERSKPRSVYALSNPDLVFDLWTAIERLSAHLEWFDAEYGSATFLPMADGALYSVHLTASGLIARPENDRAESAIENWE